MFNHLSRKPHMRIYLFVTYFIIITVYLFYIFATKLSEMTSLNGVRAKVRLKYNNNKYFGLDEVGKSEEQSKAYLEESITGS
jgi:hypothetical protein